MEEKKKVFVVKSACNYAGQVNINVDVFSTRVAARKFFNKECDAVTEECPWEDWHADKITSNGDRFLYGNGDDFILIEIGEEEVK